MCFKIEDIVAYMEKGGKCLSVGMTVVYASLAAIDGFIAITAALQLLRLYVHNRHAGWNRQKVFHCMIGASNLGYFMYFLLNLVAACRGWSCWSNACGFILIAAPQIIFLATFLLLLSFWVDLCHQATDREEEEEEDDDYIQDEGLPLFVDNQASRGGDSHRKCCLPIRRWRIRGRQRFVVVVVIGICLLTAAFAILIGYGMGDNPVDSIKMAEVYADFFAIVILFSGGGLAVYGLLLYTKMCRVKSCKASADIRKVAGLAMVSVVCFSLRAFLVLFSDIPVIWHFHDVESQLFPPLTFLYYVIGEAIPSIVVLWVMREMPPRSHDSGLRGCGSPVESTENGLLEQALIPDTTVVPQWVVFVSWPTLSCASSFLFQ